MKVLLVFGPNLAALGTREPEKYGSQTLPELTGELVEKGSSLGHDVEWRQSDEEAEVIDWTASATEKGFDAVIINPGALSHHSFGLRQAVESAGVPVIEVHMTNIYAREEFRQHSVISAACRGVIAGLGARGYHYALEALEWIS